MGKKIGELSVAIAQMKNEIGDAAEAIAADKEFLANLEKDCATKTAEWEVIVKTRTEELVALADTIKILNDDDALELFKKTLPSASSFLQVQTNSRAMKSKALEAVRSAVQSNRGGSLPRRPELDFIALALSGKQMGFEKVIAMIDELAANLKKRAKG